MLHLYTVFHLNLSYSSIEHTKHKEVIKNCYWPILNLISDHNIPIALEASGYTLENINLLDQQWIDKFKKLIDAGKSEFVGSGYTQLIGPLVPSEVNNYNLQLGNYTYKQILGIQPQIALINEQAYSAGLVEHYINNSYKAIIMEWENPYIHHPNWDRYISYIPAYVRGSNGKTLPIIWNRSVAFQKFQRYVHGEYELNEYLDYLESHSSSSKRYFPVYCNDAEIFDFRPNRYSTEEKLSHEKEWDRIFILYNQLSIKDNIELTIPSNILKYLTNHKSRILSLETPELPIPVKKQGKYNITRWAVTGRNDLKINTDCWRIYNTLIRSGDTCEEKWKELCYLWSSDFRTHITQKRWEEYLNRLNNFYKKFSLEPEFSNKNVYSKPKSLNTSNEFKITQSDKYLEIENKELKVIFNYRKGLTIDKLWLKNISDDWLCGTLHHGYFDDINWGADFFTGHIVFEIPGEPKVTDLSHLQPDIYFDKYHNALVIRGIIETSLGIIEKIIHILKDSKKIKIIYLLKWEHRKLGSLRLGHITLNPEAFNKKLLIYKTSNGGNRKETYKIKKLRIDHTKPVSFLVSSNSGIGITDSQVEIGDTTKTIKIDINKNLSALIGLITCISINNSYFYRLTLSAREMDDTSLLEKNNSLYHEENLPLIFSFTISV